MEDVINKKFNKDFNSLSDSIDEINKLLDLDYKNFIICDNGDYIMVNGKENPRLLRSKIKEYHHRCSNLWHRYSSIKKDLDVLLDWDIITQEEYDEMMNKLNKKYEER